MPLPNWTTPTSFVVGSIPSAADLDPLFSGNMNFLHMAKAFRLHRASDQSIANSSVTALGFDVEDEDGWGLHESATNPSRVTIPTALAGVWLVHVQVEFAASAAGNRQVMIYKNGSEYARNDRMAQSSGTTAVDLEASVVAAGTDYLEAMAVQTSGGALSVDAGPSLTFFEGFWVGSL